MTLVPNITSHAGHGTIFSKVELIRLVEIKISHTHGEDDRIADWFVNYSHNLDKKYY